MIDFSKVKKITIPEGVVKKIVAAGKTIWQAVMVKNWALYSTESDGKTIYNGGLGYKDGYRLRSGGAESNHSEAAHTGFIPVHGGDVVGIGGCTFVRGETNANAINVYDAEHTNIGQVVENYPTHGYGIFSDGTLSNWDKGTIKNGCYYWTVPSGADICYVRVTGRIFNSPEALIVTVNEEIT